MASSNFFAVSKLLVRFAFQSSRTSAVILFSLIALVQDVFDFLFLACLLLSFEHVDAVCLTLPHVYLCDDCASVVLASIPKRVVNIVKSMSFFDFSLLIESVISISPV